MDKNEMIAAMEKATVKDNLPVEAFLGGREPENQAMPKQAAAPVKKPAKAPAKRQVNQEKVDEALKKAVVLDEKMADKTAKKTATDFEEFAKKCMNAEIDAASCHYQTSKTLDNSINEYLLGINRKICLEVQKGGYSTNIRFRVTQNDWVNVQHIIDWYRVRGFEVLNVETNNPQYGPGVGALEYSFTISWALVK